MIGWIDWIDKCIVDYEYKLDTNWNWEIFEADKEGERWSRQPFFAKRVMGSDAFNTRAKIVESFFVQLMNKEDWNSWNKIKEQLKHHQNKLLKITAARYLFVTYILYQRSNKKLIPCSKSLDGSERYVLPETGVCYPRPYGSASATSDYDVGLIGRKSGSLTEEFNKYFEAKFKKPSEIVLDTNVYAYTLEFAIPSLFVNLPLGFVAGITMKENENKFKMQELASAFYKVFKYNLSFFKILVLGAAEEMKNTEREDKLWYWMAVYSGMNKKLGITVESFQNEQHMREKHNEKYQNIVKDMSDKGAYDPKFLGNYK